MSDTPNKAFLRECEDKGHTVAAYIHGLPSELDQLRAENAKLRAELEAARECIRRKDEEVLKMKGCAESAHRYLVHSSYVSPGTIIRLCDAALAITPESVAAEGKA